jgi:hypothetical protein
LKAKFSRGDPLRFCTRNRNLIAKDTLVGATGMGDENRDDEGAGCRALVAGHWVLVAGFWLLVAGHWVAGLWLLVSGHWVLVC